MAKRKILKTSDDEKFYNIIIRIGLSLLLVMALMLTIGGTVLTENEGTIMSSLISIMSTLIAITSLMMARDTMSKRNDVLKNYPKLILRNVLIGDEENAIKDKREFENVGSMDINDYKETAYFDITERQYTRYTDGKYIYSGERVSYTNAIGDCIFRYIQLATFVENYVVVSDGYYRLELSDKRRYTVIQKSLRYYVIRKKKYNEYNNQIIPTETNRQLLDLMGNWKL